MPEKLVAPPPGAAYTEEQRAQAIERAREIGPYRAAKELGLGPNTIRRWIDPGFLEQERDGKRRRRRLVPCIRCGTPTNPRGRKHPEFGSLCRRCLAGAIADRRRGVTVEEMERMYLDDRMSTNEIAALTGLSQTAVHGALTRYGTPMRPLREAIALHPGGQREHGKVDPNEIQRLYVAGMSTTKIAAEVACSTATVLYHLDRMGLRPGARRG
jgi:DNA-binding CsgD family transcriptional regulator